MKNRKSWTKLFGIAAVAAIIALTACSHDPCADGHTYQWVETTPAGLALVDGVVVETGVETGTCTLCGATDTRPLSFRSYFYGNWDGVRVNAPYSTFSYEISSGTFKATRTDSGANPAGVWFKMDNIVWTLAENPLKNNPVSGNDLGVTVGYIISCEDASFTHLNWSDDNLPRFIGFAPNGAKLLVNHYASSSFGVEVICERQ